MSGTTNNDKRKKGNPNIVKGNKYGKQFSSEYQPTGEAKSRGYQEKKTREQLRDEIIDKSFKKIWELLEKEELSNQDLKDIFKQAVDMSGYKKQTEEIKATGFKITINNEEIDVKRD